MVGAILGQPMGYGPSIQTGIGRDGFGRRLQRFLKDAIDQTADQSRRQDSPRALGGMEQGDTQQPYEVHLVNLDGTTTVYARYPK